MTEKDLTYLEDKKMKEVYKNSKFGMIEVIVKDTGVGIKEENL